MKYEIREIVDFVEKLQKLDPSLEIEFENIGDPIAKGWPVPKFLKSLINEETDREGDAVFGYTHSRGNPATRKWIVDYSKRFSPSSQLDFDNILITSGLGAGISAAYHMLAKGLRIIQPSPSYPTHASMESFAAEKESISYILKPENDWQPDLEDLENKLQENPDIVGILIINPNNPTGAVYSRETLEAMVDLAEKYDCMLISDEIYFRMIYGETEFAQITEIAHNRVPIIVMRGLSKDVPWPGARCGWLEFHNTHLDEDFKKYAESVKKRVLMEVCSVSLPQAILPKIYEHPEFEAWIEEYLEGLSYNINEITRILSENPYLTVNPAKGAFYMMPIFKDGVLTNNQSLEIENEKVREFVESKISEPGISADKRFVYYLLATTGICIVPASSFFSPYLGFRVTTLTRSKEQLANIYETLSKAVTNYVESDKNLAHESLQGRQGLALKELEHGTTASRDVSESI